MTTIMTYCPTISNPTDSSAQTSSSKQLDTYPWRAGTSRRLESTRIRQLSNSRPSSRGICCCLKLLLLCSYPSAKKWRAKSVKGAAVKEVAHTRWNQGEARRASSRRAMQNKAPSVFTRSGRSSRTDSSISGTGTI
jgi:hypothetical protein